MFAFAAVGVNKVLQFEAVAFLVVVAGAADQNYCSRQKRLAQKMPRAVMLGFAVVGIAAIEIVATVDVEAAG